MPSQRIFIKRVFLIAVSSKGRQQKKRKLRNALFKISTKRLRENRKKSKQQKV